MLDGEDARHASAAAVCWVYCDICIYRAVGAAITIPIT